MSQPCYHTAIEHNPRSSTAIGQITCSAGDKSPSPGMRLCSQNTLPCRHKCHCISCDCHSQVPPGYPNRCRGIKSTEMLVSVIKRGCISPAAVYYLCTLLQSCYQ